MNIIQDLLLIKEQSQTFKVPSEGAKVFAPSEGLSLNTFAPSGCIGAFVLPRTLPRAKRLLGLQPAP